MNSVSNVDFSSDLVQIIRKSDYDLRDFSYVHEDRIYKGSKNDLQVTSYTESYFRCNFDLRNYPFDAQKCSIDLKIPRDLAYTTQMKLGEVGKYIVRPVVNQKILCSYDISIYFYRIQRTAAFTAIRFQKHNDGYKSKSN